MNVCIDKMIFCIYNERESQNKSTCIGKCFFREIDSFGICEMRFAREMPAGVRGFVSFHILFAWNSVSHLATVGYFDVILTVHTNRETDLDIMAFPKLSRFRFFHNPKRASQQKL